MELELNGRIISKQPDRTTVERTILSLNEEGSILTLSNGSRGFIQAVGSRQKGFIMTGQDSDGRRQYDQLTLVGTADVILAFADFLTGSSAWKQTVSRTRPSPKQKPGQMTAKSIFIAIITIFVVVSGLVGFGTMMTARSSGQVAASEFTKFLPIAAGLALYFGWLSFLLSWLRPRLAGWLASAFGIQVAENLISGSWQTGGPTWNGHYYIRPRAAGQSGRPLVPAAARRGNWYYLRRNRFKNPALNTLHRISGQPPN